MFAGADDGVLDVGPGLALEAQRVLEVEGDDGVAGVAQHEVAERAYARSVCDVARVHRVREIGVAGVDFGSGGGDQLVEQIVGLHAEALAARDLDVGTLLVLFADGVAEVQAQRGVSATIS